MNGRTTILMLTLLALAAGSCSTPEETVEAKPRPVRTIVVERTLDSSESIVAGVARAGIESNLSFRVSGQVIDLPIVVGQRVRRGQVLASLDRVDFELTPE